MTDNTSFVIQGDCQCCLKSKRLQAGYSIVRCDSLLAIQPATLRSSYSRLSPHHEVDSDGPPPGRGLGSDLWYQMWLGEAHREVANLAKDMDRRASVIQFMLVLKKACHCDSVCMACIQG